MMRTLFVAAFVASASAFNAPASKAAFATARPAVSMPRVGAVAMRDEPSDKAITIGAACVGGIVGVYFFGDLGTAVFLAVVGAYGSTLSNGFGSTTKSAGTREMHGSACQSLRRGAHRDSKRRSLSRGGKYPR